MKHTCVRCHREWNSTLTYSRCHTCREPSDQSQPIVSGCKGKARQQVIKDHREATYFDALDKLLKGEVPPEFVQSRAKKYLQIRDKKKQRR